MAITLHHVCREIEEREHLVLLASYSCHWVFVDPVIKVTGQSAFMCRSFCDMFFHHMKYLSHNE